MASQAERHEKELIRYVRGCHISFEEWRKKNKHLSLAETDSIEKNDDVDDVDKKKYKKDKEGKKVEEKKEKKEKEEKKEKKEKDDDDDKPIPFPPECTIPINSVSTFSINQSNNQTNQLALSRSIWVLEEGSTRVCDSV